MFDFSQVQIDSIIVHQVGNKNREEGVVYSKQALDLQEDFINSALLKYFLNPFKEPVFFNFFHDASINLNDLFVFVSEIFKDKDNFYDQTINIARHLYENSQHPQIKSGEFYVVYFKDCVVEDELCDALGFFKSENKETYLKVFQKNENYELACENGININKLDKGCLIFNTEKDLGYKICMVDNINKTSEAQYWKDDFLKVRPREDDFYLTNNALNLCKSFVDKVVTEKNSYSKIDQAEVKTKAVEYFANKETFNKKEFMEEVMHAPELIEAFEDYKESYTQEHNLPDINDDFDISPKAVKDAKNNFKSIIKLDKNFTFYIHGNADMLEKGFDDVRHLKYYKLYYMDEK